MIQNIIENISDQMQADTLVEFTPGFDINCPMGLKYRIIFIKKLHTIYGTSYCHIVQGVEEKGWKDFAMEITCPSKIKCDQEILVKEFCNIWPTINQLWPQYIDKKDANLQLLTHIFNNYIIIHPNMCVLIKVLLTVSPSTRPLERSFSKLSIKIEIVFPRKT